MSTTPPISPRGGVLHLTNSTVDGASVPSEFVAGSSSDTIASTAANDIISGDGGIDTVTYTGTLTTANITTVADGDPTLAGSQAGWQVSAGAEGTDLLTGVDKVSDGAGHNFLLVGNGGYATIQAAINAAGLRRHHHDRRRHLQRKPHHQHGRADPGRRRRGDLQGTLPQRQRQLHRQRRGLPGKPQFFHAEQRRGIGVTINADNTTLQNIKISEFTTGVSFGDGIDHTVLQDVDISRRPQRHPQGHRRPTSATCTSTAARSRTA